MKGIITFFDQNKKVIEEKAINKIKYKEDLIIHESIKLFNDDNPCIIHRTYAINNISMNLLKEIEQKFRNETTLNISEIPNFIKDKIQLFEGTNSINIK